MKGCQGHDKTNCRRSWQRGETEPLEAANRFLAASFLANFNCLLSVPTAVEGGAFVPLLGRELDDILCLEAEWTPLGITMKIVQPMCYRTGQSYSRQAVSFSPWSLA